MKNSLVVGWFKFLRSYLQLNEQRIYRVSFSTYLGSPMNDKGLADDAQTSSKIESTFD